MAETVEYVSGILGLGLQIALFILGYGDQIRQIVKSPTAPVPLLMWGLVIACHINWMANGAATGNMWYFTCNLIGLGFASAVILVRWYLLRKHQAAS